MKALFGLALFVALVFIMLGATKTKRGGDRSLQRYHFSRKAPFMRDDESHLYERLSGWPSKCACVSAGTPAR